MARHLNDLLGPDETIVLQTRQHWFVVLRAVAVPVLGLVVLGGLIAYARAADWLANQAGDWIEIALWIVFGLVVLLVAWRVLGWATERFYVTTSKVVYVYGVLNRDVRSTPLVKIDEIVLRRPLLGRMLGFGRLDIENAAGGTEPLAGLEYLPRATQLYQVISERSRNQRMIEGGAHVDADADGLVDRPEPPEQPMPTATDEPTP